MVKKNKTHYDQCGLRNEKNYLGAIGQFNDTVLKHEINSLGGVATFCRTVLTIALTV